MGLRSPVSVLFGIYHCSIQSTSFCPDKGCWSKQHPDRPVPYKAGQLVGANVFYRLPTVATTISSMIVRAHLHGVCKMDRGAYHSISNSPYIVDIYKKSMTAKMIANIHVRNKNQHYHSNLLVTI